VGRGDVKTPPLWHTAPKSPFGRWYCDGSFHAPLPLMASSMELELDQSFDKLVAAVLPAIHAALEEYDQDRADTVALAYARWVSTLRQEPVVRTLLPVEIPERRGGAGTDYLYEPAPEEVLDALLPRYIESQVYAAVLENQASFYSAQMIAMQNATNAAGDLIDSLTLTANKVRQASITTELMDIVGGAEALR